MIVWYYLTTFAAQSSQEPPHLEGQDYFKWARMHEPSQFGESFEPELMESEETPLGGYGYITTRSEQIIDDF